MTNKEILAKMPIGEIVPKRILAAMKRKGLIFDYSFWGYLESARISYKDPDDSWHRYVELFPKARLRNCERNSVSMEKSIILVSLSTQNIFRVVSSHIWLRQARKLRK